LGTANGCILLRRRKCCGSAKTRNSHGFRHYAGCPAGNRIHGMYLCWVREILEFLWAQINILVLIHVQVTGTPALGDDSLVAMHILLHGPRVNPCVSRFLSFLVSLVSEKPLVSPTSYHNIRQIAGPAWVFSKRPRGRVS
jgi:hypothetical protein